MAAPIIPRTATAAFVTSVIGFYAVPLALIADAPFVAAGFGVVGAVAFAVLFFVGVVVPRTV